MEKERRRFENNAEIFEKHAENFNRHAEILKRHAKISKAQGHAVILKDTVSRLKILGIPGTRVRYIADSSMNKSCRESRKIYKEYHTKIGPILDQEIR